MSIVAEPLTRFRAPKSTGGDVRVDRTGGDYGAGIIYGASLITVGEALGHGAWIDQEFVDSVTKALNLKKKNGVKSRFTHPSLSGDGLGKFMGRAKTSKTIGQQSLGDIHFAKSAHNTPDGDLASYVMDLAEEDPSAFALSIVFQRDRGAEDRFAAKFSDKDGRFVSPDKNNSRNLRHVRLSDFLAVDFVDDPAANPNGLFHRGQDLAVEADQLCAYALGISDEKPVLTHLSADVDRLASFAARFLESHGLEVKEKFTMAELTLADVQKAIDANNTNLLSSFNANLETALAKLGKPGDAPPADSQQAINEALQKQAETINELTALAGLSGLPESDKMLSEWIKKVPSGFSIVDAKAQLGDLAIKHNTLTKGDPNPETGSIDRKLAAAYDEHAKLHKALGISKEDFIKGAKAEMLKVAEQE